MPKFEMPPLGTLPLWLVVSIGEEENGFEKEVLTRLLGRRRGKALGL